MSSAAITLAVLQTHAEDDVASAADAVPGVPACVVRPPELAAAPLPHGTRAVVAEWRDRDDAARLVRQATNADVVIVIGANERPDETLAASLRALASGGRPGIFRARRRHRFLGRDIHGAPAAIAWCAAGECADAGVLDGTLLRHEADITATIGTLDVDATRTAGDVSVPVRLADFLVRPAAALVRRLWLRRRDGIPGVILSLLESYGEVLAAAKRWERDTNLDEPLALAAGVRLPDGFVALKTPLGWMVVRRDIDERLLASLLEVSPENVLGVPVAAAGRGGVWMLALASGGRAVLRWYRRGGAFRRILRDRYFGRRPRPLVELALTEEARRRGVATVEVLGARVDRGRFGFYRGVIATRAIESASTLAEVLQRPLAAGRRTAVLAAVAAAIRVMHERGVHHRDLNSANVLVDVDAGGVVVHLIDFDRAQLRREVPAYLRRRALRRLDRSLAGLNREREVVSRDERARLARAYWEAP